MSRFPPLDTECARQLTSFAGTSPKAIAYQPLNGIDADTQNCHVIVASHTKEHGGAHVYGWMQGLAGAGIAEFVFHSVWLHEGQLIDIVPNETGKRRTVFAKDMKRQASADLMDGYNNLLFVSSREVLAEIRKFDLRASVELNKLCWSAALSIRPLTANGKFKQPALCADELLTRFGLVVEASETKHATVANLGDLSISQLQELEFDYAIDLPHLVAFIKANWPRLKQHKDVPMRALQV